ncbi:hypothetical protein JOQ06_008318, partial [Pogonophryne albipinna]
LGIGNWQQLWAVPFIVCQPPDPAMPPWGLSVQTSVASIIICTMQSVSLKHITHARPQRGPSLPQRA